MGGMSLKEKVVIAILVTVGLYFFAALLWVMSFRKSWEVAKSDFTKLERIVAKEDRTCREKPRWEQAYNDEVLKIREIDESQDADTFWMDVIGDIAERNHIQLPSRKPGREKGRDIAEMRQISIEVEWVGALESLVAFLYELETTKEGSFDVLDLDINPYRRGQPGFLSGRMTLTCIFRRGN